MDHHPGLAGAGTGQDQQVVLHWGGHHRLLDRIVQVLDDGLLQAATVGGGRGGPEGLEAEVAAQLDQRVVDLTAPGAVRLAAVVLAQGIEQGIDPGQPVAHPGGQHRIAPGHPQPGQSIGQGRAQGRVIEQRGDRLPPVITAGPTFQQSGQGGLGI